MALTFKERKELADLEYDLALAFIGYEYNKRLNAKQKYALKKVFETLHEILDDNTKELFASGKIADYFKQTYGL